MFGWSVGGHTLPAELARIVFAFIADDFTIDASMNCYITRLPRALAFLPHINLVFDGNKIEYAPRTAISASNPVASARDWLLSDFHSEIGDSGSSGSSDSSDSSVSGASPAGHASKRSKNF